MKLKEDFKKLLLVSVVVVFITATAFPCTSAIISASKNPYGRPLLWKHRDTSTIDNKVEYIPASDEGYAYVALFNSADSMLKEAWTGMNSAGFAVMNTASYNIKDDNVPAKKMDKEGIVMTKALRTCRTVDDFEKLLQSYPRPIGVEANFGVIDAEGNGAYFETNNHAFVRYDLKDASDGVLIRTNYSHSGRKNEGYGFVREADAEYLIQPYIDTDSITAEVLTEHLSRSFYQAEKGKDFTLTEMKNVPDVEFIPRYKSTATIVIEGCKPVENADNVDAQFVEDQYIMWTGMGYPPVSEIRAVRLSPDGIDAGLRGTLPGGKCALGVEAKKMRDEVFTVKGKKTPLIDISKLYNSEGSGLVQQAMERNKEIYRTEIEKRDGKLQ